jgi:hypothetical protein
MITLFMDRQTDIEGALLWAPKEVVNTVFEAPLLESGRLFDAFFHTLYRRHPGLAGSSSAAAGGSSDQNAVKHLFDEVSSIQPFLIFFKIWVLHIIIEIYSRHIL